MKTKWVIVQISKIMGILDGTDDLEYMMDYNLISVSKEYKTRAAAEAVITRKGLHKKYEINKLAPYSVLHERFKKNIVAHREVIRYEAWPLECNEIKFFLKAEGRA